MKKCVLTLTLLALMAIPGFSLTASANSHDADTEVMYCHNPACLPVMLLVGFTKVLSTGFNAAGELVGTVAEEITGTHNHNMHGESSANHSFGAGHGISIPNTTNNRGDSRFGADAGLNVPVVPCYKDGAAAGFGSGGRALCVVRTVTDGMPNQADQNMADQE